MWVAQTMATVTSARWLLMAQPQVDGLVTSGVRGCKQPYLRLTHLFAFLLKHPQAENEAADGTKMTMPCLNSIVAILSRCSRHLAMFRKSVNICVCVRRSRSYHLANAVCARVNIARDAAVLSQMKTVVHLLLVSGQCDHIKLLFIGQIKCLMTLFLSI